MKVDGKKVGVEKVDIAAEYFPFFLMNGSVLEIEFVDDATSSAPPMSQEVVDEKSACVICMDKPPNAVFISCGHCSCCFECAQDVAKRQKLCPMCRQRIQKVQKVYV